MLKIIDDTHPSLREKSVAVSLPINEENRALLLEMLEHLAMSQDEVLSEKYHLRSGVGLAAPQVGINKRLIAIYYPKDEEKKQYVKYGLVNPRIASNSVRECYLSNGEGCLSVPLDHPGHVYRSFKITVEAFDIVTNKDIVIVARGYDAVVLQHEIDHLDGILYYDRIDARKGQLDDPKALAI